MGKSGARKKKGGSNQVSVENNSNNTTTAKSSSTTPVANGGGVDLDSSIFLKRAHELKEEGNKRFQSKDYAGALEQYENALRLTPKTHADRAVFHSNRAACMIQMKPVDYGDVISECTAALQVQPRFVRALLRRARAFEALGNPDSAMLDVQLLLSVDPNHRDALDIARRLRASSASALGPRPDAQPDLQSRPSPAALGASAVRGAPIAGLGPCLPARPLQKKPQPPTASSVKLPPPPLAEKPHNQPKPALKQSSGSAVTKKNAGGDSKELAAVSSSLPVAAAAARWRALKLVYDHDIRLARMPAADCSFRELREIVAKRFPSSKAVLIKYKDNDGDLVTITSTAELRFAESCLDETDPLRLHLVEVSPEQEPSLPEEEEEEEEAEEEEEKPAEEVDEKSPPPEAPPAEKATPPDSDDPESKELEMDDWLFEFAQLFRSHVGIDPDAHVDLHEIGMELCSEALEEAVTGEEAQPLFDKAASKFQEVAALAFFNWGNVHMCAARKRIPLDESSAGEEELVAARLRTAYDWVKEKYSLAKEKYEEALQIKPDFYEGLLALGQQQFEMAKLHWSFALAKKMDLSEWDSSETLRLFDSAEEKMKVATAMWEKLEEQRANEVKDPKESSRKKKKQGAEGEAEPLSADEVAEQAAVMRSQIHLFWGNMLFERSQVECKLAVTGDWKKNLDAAVERFKLAGASEADISMVLKNHCSNGVDVTAEGGGDKTEETPVGGD